MSITSRTNKYGDILLKVPKALQGTNESEIVKNYFDQIGYVVGSQGYIIHQEVHEFAKYNEFTLDLPSDFRFITHVDKPSVHDIIAIYANESVLKKCPKVIDDKVLGSVLVLTVSSVSPESSSENYQCPLHLVLVKDRTKDYLTSPAGTMEPGETFEQCAKRECYEETGVVVNSKLAHIGTLEYNANVFEVKWPGVAQMYHCHATLSEKEMENLRTFECDEIEKVYVYPIKEDLLFQESEIDGISVSEHHQTAANHAMFKLKGKTYPWKSECPKYLKDFKLF